MNVLHHPNSDLRIPCKEVDLKDLATSNMQEFIDALISTMQEERGVGIAAPQVGKSFRVIVVDDGKGGGPEVLINPRLSGGSKKLVDSEEGCLSVPGVYGIVRRHKKIHLKAYDRHGERISRKVGGFKSVILQHEVDHLDGILFIDKMERLLNHNAAVV